MSEQLCLSCGKPIDEMHSYFTVRWPGAKMGELRLAHATCARTAELDRLQQIASRAGNVNGNTFGLIDQL